MPTARLAIDGADPLIPEGPPPWPPPDRGVLDAIIASFHAGTWGRYAGVHGLQLADHLSRLHSVRHVYLCCSGTFAVELALRALGIGPGDEVVLAAYDFGGNFRCIEAVGASPVLADIDPGTWCPRAEQVEQVLSPSVRAMLVSHLHGGLAPMDELTELARRHQIAVVEDACQAPGAIVGGRRAGTWGDVGVLSFGGSKLLSAGRGGAILTERADVYQRAKIFCERGNHAFALSELQAAVLLPQLHQLDERNELRRQRVEQLLRESADLPGLLPLRANGMPGQPSYYKLPWLLQFDPQDGRSRTEFIQAVQAEGVHLDEGFRGFARRSAQRCRRPSSLIHSEAAAAHTVVLHHPVLLEPAETVGRVAQALRRVSEVFAER